MSRLALMIDLERCTGCKSCEVACKMEHGLGPGEYRNRVVWLDDVREPDARVGSPPVDPPTVRLGGAAALPRHSSGDELGRCAAEPVPGGRHGPQHGGRLRPHERPGPRVRAQATRAVAPSV